MNNPNDKNRVSWGPDALSQEGIASVESKFDEFIKKYSGCVGSKSIENAKMYIYHGEYGCAWHDFYYDLCENNVELSKEFLEFGVSLNQELREHHAEFLKK